MKTSQPAGGLRKVRVLVNPKSGLGASFDALWGLVEKHWGGARADVSYQFSHDVADGQRKAARALADGVDTLLVAGGDGMVNSIGSALVGTSVALGVIPTGSGNGFARHFGIPLDLAGAIQTLAGAWRLPIDVGTANGRPFFVTCSMAWDAAIVRGFEALPFRGIAPYVFAAATELIGYDAQPFDVELDEGREKLSFPNPVIFTAANLTQYGGGAQIAPQARADDGLMEMVVVLRQDLPFLLVNIGRLFNGTLDRLPQVLTRRFRTLAVRRRSAAPIQLDGELVEAGRAVEIRLLPQALVVLVPDSTATCS
jgi:diacylglycerol kinase family enzyme